MAEPFDPAMPTNDYLLGQSRLGGLSLNAASGRQFVEEIIAAAGVPVGAEDLVDAILDQVPSGFLPKKQIRQILLSKRLSAFVQEAPQLDYENFGNAITPNFADFAYSDFGTYQNQKHLTSDSLQLYTRVPAKVGGVEFALSDGTMVQGTEVTMAEFQADTISYTFRLEETLAATNLPAWPNLNTRLFAEVRLRWATTPDAKIYESEDMSPETMADGTTVWEFDAKIPADRGSTYYYFEVKLAEPVLFRTLDREALAAMDPETLTLDDIFDEVNQHALTIDGWVMPDPRNLQLADRGIVDALFTDDLRGVMAGILSADPSGQNINQILSAITRQQSRRILNILLRNTNALTNRFETEFDPLLASVFTVPRVDLETQSLWVANFPPIPDGNYQVKADVLDADGNVLDRIQENITVDTTAPKADIRISPGTTNTTGYQNGDVYIATALTAGSAATLNIMGIPTVADIGPGEGYLFYQVIGLDENGNPNPNITPNTWEPLTVESTMLVSGIWEAAKRAIAEGRVDVPSDPILQTALSLPLAAILGADGNPSILTAGLLKQAIDPFLKGLQPFTGFSQLNVSQYQLIVDALGATVDILDHLVPVTFDPSDHVVMPIQFQGAQMPLVGNYGIRAMGIDSLFNVGAYTPPTHLRVVDSNDPAQMNSASITSANIGDFNNDGMVHPEYETGIIYANTESVMITGTVTQEHPVQSIVIQYMDASGNWMDIGEATVMGTDFEGTWNVTDFDALIGAGDTVMVRAVATNKLKITDATPEPFSIKLDAGIYPPEVLEIMADEGERQNPDSGAPQGMVTITASTEPLTGPKTVEVLFEIKRQNDDDSAWKLLGRDNAVASAVEAAVGAAVEGAATAPISQGTKQTWSRDVDTADLEDTITKDSPGARDASEDDNPYTIRAFAIDANGTRWPSDKTTTLSVDNIDDVEPLGPTNITAIADAEGTVEADADGYALGGLIDEHDPSVVSPTATLTIVPTAERTTYKSVRLVSDPEINADVIGDPEETSDGVFEITIDVEALDIEGNGTYTLQALAYDESGNEEIGTDDSKVSVTIENTRRPAPEILAITTDPAVETNPDSGAPKGIVTVNAYTIGEATSPLINSMGFEVARHSEKDDDSAWKPVGATEKGMVVTSEEVQELQHLNVDSLSDLITVAAGTAAASPAEPSPIHRYQTYQKWSLSIDTMDPELGLEDTIDKDSDAARDVSMDKDPYVVRAVAFSTANDSETPSPDGVQSTFSLDNVDDVGPLGPTNIVAVADVAGMIEADGDGNYTVGGIVDDTVPSPIATFTIEQTADPITYEGGSVNLVQTTEDGTETTTEGEAGVLDTITIDVGMLENGTYMFHALTVDKVGNVQPNESPMITVHVDNIRVSDLSDPVVIAVDGTEVADAPTEPISLRESVTVSFMVANASLAAEELSGAVDGSEVPSESDEDPENTFSLMVEVGGLVDGVYTPDGVITKRNGSVAFPLTTVNVDNTGPMVMIESPTDGATVESLPTVHASYHDGAGSGTDKDGQEVLPWATTELADGPTVGITRLQPEQGNTDVEVDQDAIETDNGTLVYTRTEQLPGGAYKITVQVADVLGNVGSGSQEFVINGTLPTVAIHSPASGQTFDHGQPLISGEFSGAGSVGIKTLMVDGLIVEAEVEGNRFSYTPETALANGNHTVAIEVEDGDGNTAQASVTFAVEIPRDTTPPVISAAAPTGIIKDSDPGKLGAVVISAVVTDEQSTVSSVKYSVNGGQLLSISNLHINEGKIEAPVDYEAHGDGLYTVRLIATSEGGTTEHTWTFTLIVDNVAPTITSITPSGTVRGGLPVISASANDESGVAEMSIVLIDSDGEEVSGGTLDDGEDNVSGITRLDFNPEEPLEEGVYTIEVRATDPYSNSASAKGTFTVDFDTAAPIITLASPANNARLMYAEGEERRPTIAISYADAESGIDVDSIRFVFNDNLITLTPQQKSASQVTYKPAQDLEPGQYSVKLEVSDRANQEGNVSDESDGAREANMAVYQFTFSVELQDGPILAARPLNYPNPFKDNTRISFTLARQATVSIVIYDATLRPVRVLVDNQVFDAGNYTRKDNGSDAIGWDGTSSSGEDLARGIYFCEIIVADGFEPEYAILKLALTR